VNLKVYYISVFEGPKYMIARPAVDPDVLVIAPLKRGITVALASILGTNQYQGFICLEY